MSEWKMSVLTFSCFSRQLLGPILFRHAHIGPMHASLCSTLFRSDAANVLTQSGYLAAGLSAMRAVCRILALVYVELPC